MLAHVGRGPAQRLEYLLFTLGFSLLARDRLAALAVDRLQRDDVIASETGYRADEQRLDPAPLADLAPDLTSDFHILRPLHQSECLSRPFFGENVQVGRLLKLNCQTLFECPVKDFIAGRVDEVREQDRIFAGQRRAAWTK